MVANTVSYNHLKHTEIDHHFIREYEARCQLLVCFVPSEDQLVDIMTKPLLAPIFVIRNKLFVQHRPVSLAEGRTIISVAIFPIGL